MINEPINICISEKQNLLRITIMNLISLQVSKANFIAQSNTNSTLINDLRKQPIIPDIAILDITTQILRDIEAIEKIKKLFPKIKILILSIYTEPNIIQNLFNKGINGFISKESASLNFTTIFRELLGTGFLKNQWYKKPFPTNLNWNKYAFIGYISFTHTELKFMQLSFNGLTIPEIANKLYASKKTIENYRDTVYQKLQITCKVDLIKKIIQFGLQD